MDLVLLLLALALVGGVAAVALGTVRGGLEPPTSSLPMTGLPAGEVAAGDVDELRFSLGLRGYRMDEVDDALARLRAEIIRRDHELAVQRAELATLRARDPRPLADPAAAQDDAAVRDVSRGPGWTA